MKKILSLVTLTSLFLGVDAQNYIESWGQLKLTGVQLSSQNGYPVQLKGIPTSSTWNQDFTGCMTEEQLESYKSYGANVVRLSVNIDQEDSYEATADSFKTKVKECIDNAYNAGIYIIVDWHTSSFGKLSGGDPTKIQDEAKDFFGEISAYSQEKKYKHVLYEICNEPMCNDWQTLKEYSEYVIPSILDNQPEAIVIVGTNFFDQEILEPIDNPLDQYKNNVMYSFHYYACSHYNLMGRFKDAQKSIPVFATGWTPKKFDLNGPGCNENAEPFVAACDNITDAPQIVSWCLIADGELYGELCDVRYLQGYGWLNKTCTSCPPPPCIGCDIEVFEDYNQIPTTKDKLFRWDAFDYGGEGVAYHDQNSSAWNFDADGAVASYRVDGAEVDVLSLAYEMQWINEAFPYSKVEEGKVVEFESTVNTEWKDALDNPTYKSLNAGRNISGLNLRRPNDGVDVASASCKGTDFEDKGFEYLISVEDHEWINYTVSVTKAGYYKISALVNAEYKASNPEGEIEVSSNGVNILRVKEDIKNDALVNTFGFGKTTSCADQNVEDSQLSDCWSISDAKSAEFDEVLVAFHKEGVNQIKFTFDGDATGVGPLMFEFYQDLDENDPITSVENKSAKSFSIYPNPTTGGFSIILDRNTKANVDVVNVAGQVVVSKIVYGSATISNSLTPGVYSVVVRTDNGVNTQKLIVR